VRRHYGSDTAPVPPNPARALEFVRILAAAQRKTADDLREAVRKAKDAGVSWAAVGEALGVGRETAFRQYKCGSPIVVVRGHQNPSQ